MVSQASGRMRLLARSDGKTGLGQWRITGGTYRIVVGKSVAEPVLTAEAPLVARLFGQ